jgi:hypothetical protein
MATSLRETSIKINKFFLVLLLAISQQSLAYTPPDHDRNKFIDEAELIGKKFQEDAQPFDEACYRKDNLIDTIKAFAAFKDNGDGTLTDPRNGLVWQRCALGQTWDGNTCSGVADSMNWYYAMKAAKANKFAGMADWRLPTKAEFMSVMQNRNSECKKQLQYVKERNSKYFYDLMHLYEAHFGSGGMTEDDIHKEIVNSDRLRSEGFKQQEQELKIPESVSKNLAFLINRESTAGFVPKNVSLGEYWSISPQSTAYEPISMNGGTSYLANFNDSDSDQQIQAPDRVKTYQVRLVRAGKVGVDEAALFDSEFQRADKGLAELKIKEQAVQAAKKAVEDYSQCMQTNKPKLNQVSVSIESALAMRHGAQQEIQRQREGAKYSGFVNKQVMQTMGERIASMDKWLPELFQKYKSLGGTAKKVEDVRAVTDPCAQ